MKDYKCYLFDADGTIIDTTELIYQCFNFTSKRVKGEEIDRQSVIDYTGLPLRDQMEIYFGHLTDYQFAEMAKKHNEYQLSIYTQYLRLFPGTYETISSLKKGGKLCVIVTSRKQHSLKIYLQHTGILSLFDVLVTEESTINHKPQAEPALYALSLLRVGPENALFIGDSVFDIQCGNNAGIDTAFVAWSHTPVASLTCKPTYVITAMNELIVDSTKLTKTTSPWVL